MEETSQSVRYLSLQEIIAINQRAIDLYGGWGEMAGMAHNPEALRYLIEFAQVHEYYSHKSPDLFDIAAFYATHIITRHVFFDGNKRTGMISALYFIAINGIPLSPSLTDEILIELATKISLGELNSQEVSMLLKQFLSDGSPIHAHLRIPVHPVPK